MNKHKGAVKCLSCLGTMNKEGSVLVSSDTYSSYPILHDSLYVTYTFKHLKDTGLNS